MNEQIADLELHFDTAFSAPNGIKKLRELILTLAMQGKLVSQDPSDAPASELLKEIDAEKKRLVKECKIKAPKLLPLVTAEEMPYSLPLGWEWTRTWRIAQLITSGSRDWAAYLSDSGAIFVTMGNLSRGSYQLRMNNIRYVNPPDRGEGSRTKLEENDLLISITGDVGNLGLIPPNFGDAYINQHTCLLRFMPLCRTRYFPELMRSPLAKQQFDGPQRGIKNSFRLGDVGEMLIPLPPLPEQHRIVTKIDQLMARCDALENLRNERDKKRLATHSAALSQLLDTTDNGRADDAWAFITQHFGDLYAVKENVAELRKAILQLAVMGKLVSQDPNDPPASELFKDIESEQHPLRNELKVRASKLLPKIASGDTPYALPNGWVWVKLGELGATQTGTTPPSKNQENYGHHIPFVGPGNIKNGQIDYSGEGLSKVGLSNGRLIKENSILMVCIGGSIGKHAINDRDVSCNQQINSFSPGRSLITRFAYWILATEYFQKSVRASAGGSATPIINKQKWTSIPIPVPPLAEQHRIVAKIDQLMGFCVTLEERIAACTKVQTELLNAVLAQA